GATRRIPSGARLAWGILLRHSMPRNVRVWFARRGGDRAQEGVDVPGSLYVERAKGPAQGEHAALAPGPTDAKEPEALGSGEGARRRTIPDDLRRSLQGAAGSPGVASLLKRCGSRAAGCIFTSTRPGPLEWRFRRKGVGSCPSTSRPFASATRDHERAASRAKGARLSRSRDAVVRDPRRHPA